MRRLAVLAAMFSAVAACAVLRPREAFSEAALMADPDAYVAHRYRAATMSVELRGELAAAGYVCEPLPSGGHVCSRNAPRGPGCADVFTVRITPPHVDAGLSRRCAGPVSPP